MTGGDVVGFAVFALAFAFGALSIHQLATGRGHWLRKPALPPTPDKIRAGAWAGIGLSAMFMCAGLSGLTSGLAADVLGGGGYGILMIGGVWGAVGHWKQRTSSHVEVAPPTADNPDQS